MAVLAPQESLTQDVPEPYSLDRITPADAQSDKMTEEFSNKALDATRKLGPIEIDGRIDEPDWEMAKVFTGFTAKEPIEGEPAKDDTEVRVLLGDGAIWIGARMWELVISEARKSLLAPQEVVQNRWLAICWQHTV